MKKDLTHSIYAFLQKGGPYEYGCSLFFSITHNRMLAARLMASDSETNREMLKYELEKYLHSQPNYWDRYLSGEFDSSCLNTISQEQAPGDTETLPLNNLHFLAPIQDPDLKSKVLNTRKDLYRDRGHLHGRLHQAATPSDRLIIQKEMIKVQKAIDGLNRDLILIDQGEIPQNYIQSTTTVDNFKNRESINRSIRRNQKKLRETIDPDLIKKYQSKIEAYKKQLEQ